MATAAKDIEQDEVLNLELLMAQAKEARRDYEDAAKEYRQALRREMELEHSRHQVKHEACLRLKGTQNALTEKPHTGTSAEAIVETDEVYAKHLQAQRDIVYDKNTARTRMESAKIRCEIAVAAIKASAGLI